MGGVGLLSSYWFLYLIVLQFSIELYLCRSTTSSLLSLIVGFPDKHHLLCVLQLGCGECNEKATLFREEFLKLHCSVAARLAPQMYQKACQLSGLVQGIPYKEAIIDFCDEVHPLAQVTPEFVKEYICCSSAHFETKGQARNRELVGITRRQLDIYKARLHFGPPNYNPVEEWFFHRLKAVRPIPIPNWGIQITQLGHVKDLATTFIKVLGNEKVRTEVFNISGDKYITFDGLVNACAKVGGFPEPEIIHYNPKEFDFEKK